MKNLNFWLNTADGKAFLKECSKHLLKVKERYLVSRNKVLWDRSSSYEQRLNDLCTELYLFIHDNERVLNKLQALISKGNHKSVISSLGLMYRSHLKDQIRGSGGSFYANLYRRIQLTLSRHNQFTVLSRSGYSYYAALKDADLPFIGRDFFQTAQVEDFPDPEIHEKWDNENELVAWAAFFWEHTTSLAGNEYLIPIRELTYYLISKNCVYDQTATFESTSSADGQNQEEDLQQDYPDPNPGPGISSEKLARLAEEIVSDWDDRMVRAFYIYNYQEKNLEETAAAVGYAGASGVRNLLSKAVYQIREKTSSWPGFYEEEMDEESAKIFLDNLFSSCRLHLEKNSSSGSAE